LHSSPQPCERLAWPKWSAPSVPPCGRCPCGARPYASLPMTNARPEPHRGKPAGSSRAPPGPWWDPRGHLSCRTCQRGAPPRRLEGFPTQKRQELRQNGACCHREKTRHVAVRRPDTLCVRRVVSLFLLKQWLVAFGDSNYGRETTLIMTINNLLCPAQLPCSLHTLATDGFNRDKLICCNTAVSSRGCLLAPSRPHL